MERMNPEQLEKMVHSALRSLPNRRAPATLELMDVSGRRVMTREVGQFGAGAHTLRLDGERTLPAGVYFGRLTQGARSISTRGVILR